jgi:hypothetical protein
MATIAASVVALRWELRVPPPREPQLPEWALAHLRTHYRPVLTILPSPLTASRHGGGDRDLN